MTKSNKNDLPKEDRLRGPQVDTTTELTQLYAAYPWHDLWQDAKIEEAISYARGSKKLRLPPEWRRVLPQAFPENSESEEGF